MAASSRVAGADLASHSHHAPALATARATSVAAMRYRLLGRSGCAVSELCLGTMTFGAETADVYSAGVSEQIIGHWLAARPRELVEPIVIATKGRFATEPGPNGNGLSARHLTRALD